MINTSRLPLNALRAFECTARLGSLRAASDELCVTHGAVSLQIKKLESYLGCPLLEKQGRGVALNAEGQHLFERLQPLFVQLAAAARVVDPNSQEGPLTVGCSRDTAVLWLVPALPEFVALHPGIELEIREVSAGLELPPDVDVAVLTQLPETASTHLSLLSDQFFFPVCHPDLLSGKDHTSDRAMADLPLLHADRGGLWSAWFREASMVFPETVAHTYLPGGAVAISGARSGLGVALAHHLEVQTALENQELVRIGTQQIKAANAYFIATHSGQPSTKAKLFENWLRKKYPLI